MFDRETVFILGAGASKHYGYPTGEELVQCVIEKARKASRYLQHRYERSTNTSANPPRIISDNLPAGQIFGNTVRDTWKLVADQFADLADRLDAVSPLVIDYFLGHNRHLESVGKFCIAWELAERETNYNEARQAATNTLNSERWCRFILHKLTTGCKTGGQFLENKVKFVTFNYDLSLEMELYSGIKSLREFEDVAETFASNDRLIHVYGRIRDGLEEQNIEWQMINNPRVYEAEVNDFSILNGWHQIQRMFDYVYGASKGIEIIAPNKITKTGELRSAVSALHASKCVYVLGYGFDRYNSELLELPSIFTSLTQEGYQRHIMFTNYNNSGVVNKNAAKLFDLPPAEIMDDRATLLATGRAICEKSIRTVYGALALDFSSPEEQV